MTGSQGNRSPETPTSELIALSTEADQPVAVVAAMESMKTRVASQQGSCIIAGGKKAKMEIPSEKKNTEGQRISGTNSSRALDSHSEGVGNPPPVTTIRAGG